MNSSCWFSQYLLLFMSASGYCAGNILLNPLLRSSQKNLCKKNVFLTTFSTSHVFQTRSSAVVILQMDCALHYLQHRIWNWNSTQMPLWSRDRHECDSVVNDPIYPSPQKLHCIGLQNEPILLHNTCDWCIRFFCLYGI